MKNTLKNILTELNQFAKDNQLVAEFWLHAEQSKLMRFANSAVSLNTHDDSMTLSIVVYDNNANGAFSLVTNSSQIEDMKKAVLTAAEMAKFSTPASYKLSVTAIKAQDDSDKFFDQKLLDFSPAQTLAFVNQAVDGLESDQISMSGSFSAGAVWQALTNTLSEVVLVHATTDAHVSLVLSHNLDKWELTSDQSAAKLDDLDASEIHEELAVLLHNFTTKPHFKAEADSYDIVFGREAISNFVSVCNWIGFSGGGCKRGMTFLKEEDIGKKVFSEKISIVDDPSLACTFPYAFDCNGLTRQKFPFIENGVFKGFSWDRDSADEFEMQETAHTVPSMSLSLSPGDKDINSLAELIAMPREKDLLYFPFLHYKNVVNATQSIFTGVSRFGALLLKKDGTVEVPYNLRLTDSILSMFNNIDWISSETVATNVSGTYGDRNAEALLLPKFIKINDVSITRTNNSF